MVQMKEVLIGSQPNNEMDDDGMEYEWI